MSIEDMAEVFDELGEDGIITRTRYVADTFVKGRATRGAGTTVPVEQAVVFPGTGKTLEQLDEHTRTRRIEEVMSVLDWRTADDDAGTRADEATYDGDTFEVLSVKPWKAGNFYHAVLARVAPVAP